MEKVFEKCKAELTIAAMLIYLSLTTELVLRTGTSDQSTGAMLE